MKSIKTLFAWAILLCLPIQIFAQKNRISKEYLVKQFSFYKNPDPALNHLNYFEKMAATMQLTPASEMVLQEESTDDFGITHFKFQQFHAGLPVFGNRYILHEKDGRIMTASGHYTPQANAVSKPGINTATALAFAKKAIKAREYEARAVEPTLCFIDPAFPKVSESLRLAYQIDLQSTEPFDKRRYFVDAASGKILTQFPLIMQEGVPSTAKTKYYGVQNIITDSLAPHSFVLRDLSRGEGIFISNNDGVPFTNSSSNWDLTNDQQDEVALDAHYCTQEYYDMMLADYAWQGLDGQGKALKVNVHSSGGVEAYWVGGYSHFGDGDCNYGPLVTLEVVGHEFTHGMIDYSSRLVSDTEPGAINESLADIFGKMLERKADPINFSWNFGQSYILTSEGKPSRVMDDPKSVEMPALYKGLHRGDKNDVHVNSSIGNLWFTMIADGKQGINEAGTAFDVPAIGMDKAGQIVFQVNKNYFTESSNYNAFCQYSIEVAETLYGAGSTEVTAVTEAWKAVGLPSIPSPIFDLNVLDEGSFDNTYCEIGQYIPVNFKIANSGTIPYNPSMLGKVTLSKASIPDRTIHLTTPILPGEIFEIQVNDWLKASEGNISVSGIMIITDEKPDNNYSYKTYVVNDFESSDLGLSAISESRKCFDSTYNVSFFVWNNTCESVPNGTVLDFTSRDNLGNITWAGDYTLTEDLIGNSTVYIPFEIPNNNTALMLELLYSEDPETANNQFNLNTPQAYLPITENYFNNFEINFGQDDYLSLFNSTDQTIFYQNSHFFATSGLYDDPNYFQQCSDPLTAFNFENAEGVNASIHACVDFSLFQSPTLEFDLAQFRNSFADTSNYMQSSMLQAKWTGNVSGSQVIFDQPEGLVKHYNIQLPPFFKGALDLSLYAELGRPWFDPAFLNEHDFILFDNLKLSAQTSDIYNTEVISPILISPNPTNDITNIQTAEGIKTILLQNISGQTLQTLQLNATTANLDLSNLVSGLYVLGIQLSNGAWTFRKLVKM